MFGWDWGPRLVSCGIWKPVQLIESDGAPEPEEPTSATPKVRLLQESDAIGESFEFEIDGCRTWIRGANWIPDHSFPSTITKAQLRAKLEMAKEMGFNMLRVWGGGIYESDDFYDLCDELGIYVWQDFPFACSYYPENPEFIEAVRKEAEFHVLRLRHHTSLALWCGNNECEMLHYDGWSGEKGPKEYLGASIYEDVLRNVVQRLDPDRPYIRSSPIGNASTTTPNGGEIGDQHYWDVWHGRGDWRYYSDSTARFSSEFGFASSCSLATWSEVLGEDALDYPFELDDPALIAHDKTRKGTHTFVGYVRLHYPEPETLADWVYYSQLNQRDAIRFGVEHYRRTDFCRGALIWQFNDCWPVQSWSILDSNGYPKALGYELKRLFADQLISVERKNDWITVHAINDGVEPWSSELQLSAISLSTGAMVDLGMTEFDLGPDARQAILETSVKGLSVPDTLLHATAGDAYSWMLLAEPKQAKFPDPCPILASTSEEGFLTLRVSTPVVDLMLTDENDVGHFGHNFAILPEAGTYTIPYGGTGEGLMARSLAGWHRIELTRSPI
jgi:beta-mannosidase